MIFMRLPIFLKIQTIIAQIKFKSSLSDSIFIICASIFPILLFYNHNQFEAPANVVILPIILSCGVSLIVFVIIRKLFLKNDFLLPTVLLCIIFNFFYGPLYLFYADILDNYRIIFNVNFLVITTYILLYCAYIFSSIYIIKNRLNTFIISIVMLLFLYNSMLFTYRVIVNSIYSKKIHAYFTNTTSLNSLPESALNKPNIYYFVFDRYPRSDILKKFFKFDTTSFYKVLEKQGFNISYNAYANYPRTFASLVSSLNSIHLYPLSKILNTDFSNKSLLFPYISNNKVASMLKNIGYNYIFLGSFWEGSRYASSADKNITVFNTNKQFYEELYQTTAINYIAGIMFNMQVFSGVNVLYNIPENTLFQFEQLKQISKNKNKTFVFGHFILPHPPYLLDKNCKKKSLNQVRYTSLHKGYIDQIQCTNKLILDFLQHTNKNDVIILQSDEGPFIPEKYFDKDNINPKYLKTSTQIHTSILLGIKLNSNENKYTIQTPINIFPFIFNSIFKTNIPFFKDTSYINIDEKYPMKLLEVTKLLSN